MDALFTDGICHIEIAVVGHGIGITVNAVFVQPNVLSLILIVPQNKMTTVVQSVLRKGKYQQMTSTGREGVGGTDIIEGTVWQSSKVEFGTVVGEIGAEGFTPACPIVSALGTPQIVGAAAH